MRKFQRAIAATALSLPMALAVGGAASAAEGPSFGQQQTSVGPEGVATKQVSAQSSGGAQGGSGDAQFHQQSSSVGPDGVSSSHVSSDAGNGGVLGVLGL